MQVAQPNALRSQSLSHMNWRVTEPSLDSPNVTFDDHPITVEDLSYFDEPFELKTPKLVLNLRPSYLGKAIPVTFETGPIVTLRQILGAINTYYSMPITVQDLDEIVNYNHADIYEQNDAVKLDKQLRPDVLVGEEIPRSEIMWGLERLGAINELEDGSLDIILRH
jgi:hypothetical protein